MLNAFKKIFPAKPPEAVRATYIALLAQARNPFFFGPLQVPDTLDGRFELVVLHLFLLQQRLRETEPEFARFLSEIFFADMDRSLRELGVADTGVKHRIRKMGKAYHGRLQAYAAGLASNHELQRALARNLYGTVEQGDISVLARAAGYVQRMAEKLAATPVEAITSRAFQWPPADAAGA
jgi:cytochrome b pre-mRNA-processing protein 3